MKDDIAPYALVEERPHHVEEHIEDPEVLFVKYMSVNFYQHSVSNSSIDIYSLLMMVTIMMTTSETMIV